MRRLLDTLLVFLVTAGMLFSTTETEAQADGDYLELHYAECFSIEWLAGGAARLIAGNEEYLILPADTEIPPGLDVLPRITIPAKNIYLASSSAADLFLQAGALSAVHFSGTSAENWLIPELRESLETEQIFYAGKYSAPDFELLLTEGCDLAVENTMILHSPATREKLEELGVPVLVEYSSYEPHPLGRVEWVKLYGLLTGRLDEAEAFFTAQEELFRTAAVSKPSGKTVAFFHLTPAGAVVVRRRADYVTRMIEFAGGQPTVTDLPEKENALSTVSIQMESFYAQACDADILIYNSTVAGDVETMEQFLALNPLLKNFRAVRENHVWCTEMSMFQRSSAAAGMVADLRAVISDTADENLHYLHKVKD